MRDSEVRAAVAHRIARAQGHRAHLLVDEVEVRGTGRRMDLLLVATALTAFEIKSDVDSLARLVPQAAAYSLVAERAVLVVGRRHISAAAGAVPAWWAVWEATRGQRGGLTLRVARRGLANSQVQPDAVAGLLLRDEILAELSALGGTQGLGGRPIHDLRRELAFRAGDTLLARVRRQLLWRGTWRARALSAA